ncbi:hypothetical protein DTO013E5_8435 [Penicillium roqueforti]|nr:hypothetical protein CBS147337_5923 [Penicillium roqueforti]KAI2735384.1 hypothetical protein DTO013F2_10139 [Penicillium roqueforti]KAI2743509.1 hypothetical protein DTO012A1_3423 [Penicillium roqueforti]KAI2758548.1 hypothetical protein DTO006G1_6400 [Penicillium roqueforti]KAI3192636.1 hypothetical protein DTO027I6_7981 [Penicillium roqueforti]
MINHFYPNGDESQPQDLDPSDQDSQYAPTPGYYEHTPPSEYGFSPSPNRCPQDGSEPLLSIPPETNKLLQLSEWEANRPDDELPASFIRYTIEWKVKVNNRSISEDTEQDVALTPSAYWPLALRDKLYKVIEEKVARKRRVRSDDTSIVVSINDRKQHDLKKRFNGLNIDWSAVEKQLLVWGKFYTSGKELRLRIIFNYIEDDHSPRSVTGRTDKRGRSSITKRMLNERDEQLDAEQHTTGEQSIWRAVYNLMRCPSPSCHLGPHCWQDPHGKKHYQLRTHHLKRLIAYIEGGGILECQDDVPDAVHEELFLEEQQKLESLQSKGNKILAPGNCPPININFMGGQPHLQSPATNSIPALATPPPQNGQIVDQLIIDGPRDMAVREYTAWQETNVVDDNLKAQFRQACDVTLANGLDLEQIHEDHNPGFFIEKGVAVGIARRFISDIDRWVRHVRN